MMHANSSTNCDFTLEVVGEGAAAIVPDRAVIVLGVVNEGIDLSQLQSDNAAAIKAVSEALAELGISGNEQIGTATFQIEPQYDYIDGKQQFRGYRITHLLRITMADIADTGKVIDAAVGSGANTVSHISFESSEASKAQQTALAHAVSNAQEKASTIAQAMGVSLSAIPCKAEEITESSPGPVMFKAAMQASDVSTVIEPGQLTFKAAVRVRYLYA